MSTSHRYLTKSKFQTALECPTKLYYYGKPEYPCTKDDDAFLQSLAEGGFQVGALAKCYHPGGIDVTELDYERSLQQTNKLLSRETVTIFEAAVRFENLFIRIDILEKTGNELHLIEVKAKSIDPGEDHFLTKRGDYINKDWLPYLTDVAFQTWVAEHAFPGFTVHPYLMLADKSQIAEVDGLNQHFFLKKENNRTFVKIKGNVEPGALGNPVLVELPVRHLVDRIFNGTDLPPSKKNAEERKSFVDRIREYADFYQRDAKYPVTPGRKCKDCEYRIHSFRLDADQHSGFRECWKEALAWDDAQFEKPLVFDIWNYRKTEACIDDGIYLMEDLNLEEEFMQPDTEKSLRFKSPAAERQYLQVSSTLKGETKEHIHPDLFNEMAKWQYPLHFIDFETSMVAIPFTKRRRPYEQIAFQFSCHTVHENGTCEHHEWIARRPGYFPNFDFIAELKNVLDKDDGTIFRYATHENTVLRQIQQQLIDARETGWGLLPEHHAELIGFIDTITEWADEDGTSHPPRVCGPRNMVDLRKLVLDYYYHPAMGGSNSIKAVLPTVIQSSSFLKEKYSRPYNSKNYKDMIWWQFDAAAGKPYDPYKRLPPLYENIDLVLDELVLESDSINEGGAAMVAYARMQFTEMSGIERGAIINGLLKYCELDTLAMVMIWEHWKSIE